MVEGAIDNIIICILEEREIKQVLGEEGKNKWISGVVDKEVTSLNVGPIEGRPTIRAYGGVPEQIGSPENCHMT